MPSWDAEVLRQHLGGLTSADLRCLVRSALSVPLGVGLVASGCGGDTVQETECGRTGCAPLRNSLRQRERECWRLITNSIAQARRVPADHSHRNVQAGSGMRCRRLAKYFPTAK